MSFDYKFPEYCVIAGGDLREYGKVDSGADSAVCYPLGSQISLGKGHNYMSFRLQSTEAI
jgi:hypothetical protein